MDEFNFLLHILIINWFNYVHFVNFFNFHQFNYYLILYFFQDYNRKL
jgi:hypothetical protein